MKKRCSGCMWFHKAKRNTKRPGICDYDDSRTDSGSCCSFWKGIKYNRNDEKDLLDGYYKVIKPYYAKIKRKINL